MSLGGDRGGVSCVYGCGGYIVMDVTGSGVDDDDDELEVIGRF